MNDHFIPYLNATAAPIDPDVVRQVEADEPQTVSAHDSFVEMRQSLQAAVQSLRDQKRAALTSSARLFCDRELRRVRLLLRKANRMVGRA